VGKPRSQAARPSSSQRQAEAPCPTLQPLGKHNPRLAELRRVVRREDPSRTVVDGTRLVLELAEAGIAILELFATPEAEPPLLACPHLRELWARRAWHLVTGEALAAVAPTQHPQGVLAVVGVPDREPVASGTWLYLDGIQEPGNLGALVRCAAALGADGVACSADGADPFSPRAVRGAAGWSLRFPVCTAIEFEPLAASFTLAGGTVAAAVGEGGRGLAGWRPRAPLLLVLGSEGRGVRPGALAACTERVTIPLARGVESLNVAVAAGIILAALAGVASAPILERCTRKRRAS